MPFERVKSDVILIGIINDNQPSLEGNDNSRVRSILSAEHLIPGPKRLAILHGDREGIKQAMFFACSGFSRRSSRQPGPGTSEM